MEIRHSRPGDEPAQVRIYNAAAAALPGFKPADAEEVARRYRAPGADAALRLFAEEGGEVVGYAAFNPSGRVSYPWCRPGAESVRGPLLEAVLDAMRRRGLREAWAAYRADWREPVLRFLEDHGFGRRREVINYVAEVAGLPRTPPPTGLAIGPLGPDDVGGLLALGRGVFLDETPEELGAFFWENPYFGPEALFGLRRGDTLLGAGLAVADARYADPTRIDAAMPCFRLGAFGTERERHKRVDGMVSVAVAPSEPEISTLLLAEAARRLEAAGRRHAAAQAPSDSPELTGFYDGHFRRQGAFPVLARAC